MKKVLLAALLCLVLVSCDTEQKYFLRSYVMFYEDAKEITLSESYSKTITIEFARLSGLGNFQSTGQLKESYDALCEKHGDMTFLREYNVGAGLPRPSGTTNVGIDFVSIDIVSDSDFDAQHLAGTSLADVVVFNSRSLKPFIDSGYTSLYNGDVYHPVKERVSELIPDQLILLGGDKRGLDNYLGKLIFDSKPTLSKTHKFTVTMTADDGRVFSASVDMEFE